MKRGELWIVAGGPDYAGKSRPAIILQSDKFDATQSITICPLTGTPVENVYVRFPVTPSRANGLQIVSHAMVDKISTVPKSKLDRRIGALDKGDLVRLTRSVALFLGLAD